MRKRTFRPLYGLLLFHLLRISLTAQPSVVSGNVFDPQGRGIGAATVSLAPSGGATQTVRTGADGSFTIADVTHGSYHLTVSAAGFQEYSQVVDSSQGGPLRITLAVSALKSTVTVSAQQEGLVVQEANAGSLTNTPLLDLPQSVQVVNRQLLDEQKAYQYADSITYLAAVQRSYTSIAGAIGNEVAIRGFQLDFSNNYLRDGFKFYGLALSDTADIESVEVLKGPASALYGTAEAGGIVNIITKKPTETPYIAISMTGGSYQYLRPDFDISGPLNASRTLFYRLNGVYEDQQSFRRYAHSERYFIAPYLLWRPSSKTSLVVSGELINANRNSDYGLVLLGSRPASVPVSTSYTEPWNNEDDRDRQIGYRLTHVLSPDWTLYNGFQLSRTNARYLEVFTTGPDTDPAQLTRLSDAFYFPTLYRYSQTNLTGVVRTGPVRHHLAAGFEAGWVDQQSEGPAGFAPDVNVLKPVVGSDFSLPDAVAALANPYFSLTYKTLYQNQSGYVQDQLDLGRHWKAIGGFRFERFAQDSINQSNGTHQRQTDYPVSPRAGIVYQPIAWLSVYASYVRSFIPTAPGALSAAAKQFTPERDRQWEAGVKVAPGNGRTSVTVALFDIQKNNILAPDPTNQLFSVQNGQADSKGLEFEFRGSLANDWSVLTSYSYIQAQVTKSVVYPVGSALPNAPKHSGAVWSTYRIPRGVLKGVGISAGVVATGSRQDNYFNTALLPGYARLDVGSYYEFRLREKQSLRLSVNIQNALDRTYYLASNGQDQIRPGSPINTLAGVRWTWR